VMSENIGLGAANVSLIQTLIADMNSSWNAYRSSIVQVLSNCIIVTQAGYISIQQARDDVLQIAPMFTSSGGQAALDANQAFLAVSNNVSKTVPINWNQPCLNPQFVQNVFTATAYINHAYSDLLKQLAPPPLTTPPLTTPPLTTPPLTTPPLTTPPLTTPPLTTPPLTPPLITPPLITPPLITPVGVTLPPLPTTTAPSVATATAPPAGTSSTGNDVLIAVAVTAGLAAVGAGILMFSHRQHRQHRQQRQAKRR
jgi:hypothetical protein